MVLSSILFSLCRTTSPASSSWLLFSVYLADRRGVSETHLLSGVEVGRERDCVGEETYPSSPVPQRSPASSCRFPAQFCALADPAANSGPGPALLSDPLFTEGRMCLEPQLRKWKAGVEGRIFPITTEIGEIWTWTLKREVLWSPRRQLTRQGVWELGIKTVSRTGWVVLDKLHLISEPHFPCFKQGQC